MQKVRGTVASVERLERSDLVALLPEWFAPSRLTVVVVGDVDEAARACDGLDVRSPTGAAASSRPVDGARRRTPSGRAQPRVGADDEQGADRRGVRFRRRPPADPDYPRSRS